MLRENDLGSTMLRTQTRKKQARPPESAAKLRTQFVIVIVDENELAMVFEDQQTGVEVSCHRSDSSCR